jgi:hypothetical protein
MGSLLTFLNNFDSYLFHCTPIFPHPIITLSYSTPLGSCKYAVLTEQIAYTVIKQKMKDDHKWVRKGAEMSVNYQTGIAFICKRPTQLKNSISIINLLLTLSIWNQKNQLWKRCSKSSLLKGTSARSVVKQDTALFRLNSLARVTMDMHGNRTSLVNLEEAC